jgi:phosphocarrier protein
LHARPAAAVVELAGTLPAVVAIHRGDRVAADARSLLSLIALGAEQGDEVTLRAEGDGAEQAVSALADLIASDQDA